MLKRKTSALFLIYEKDAKFCNRDFIYECGKCKKIDVTHIRKIEAINDYMADM